MTKARDPDKSSPTIRGVARHAGVSPMSVSNVLNGRRVTPAIREAVEQSIAALNYVPNPAARQLSRGTYLSIGILYGPLEHPLASAMMIGASTAASRLGAQLLPQSVPWGDSAAAWKTVRSLCDRGAKAILLPPGIAEAMAGQPDHACIDIPLMAIAIGAELPGIPSVRIDEVSAARDMTKLLIGKGHKRIAFIRSSTGSPARETRFAGYREALNEQGIPFDPELVREAQMTFEGGLHAAASLLDQHVPPDAIFASNDDMAAGALVAAHKRNLTIPGQLAIAGFDDSFLASRVWPALTSVHQPIAAMAELAIEMLVDRIRMAQSAQAASASSILMDYTLINRASTGD